MLSRRYIALFDLDAFFVSVERLLNPALCGVPVIVGGGDRGVVSTCSYEARHFGIHSAMPMKEALRLCPEAVVVCGHRKEYLRYSEKVKACVQSIVPVFEQASIDEFYLDFTGMELYYDIRVLCSNLKKRIFLETGLPVSYALSSSKIVSKIACEEAKPNGQIEIPFGMEQRFLYPIDVGKMPLVGKKVLYLLNQKGIKTIGDLGNANPQVLVQLLGKLGMILHRRANGKDEEPVRSQEPPRSISTESTFSEDIRDADFLDTRLVSMLEKVTAELRRKSMLTSTLSIKLRYYDFSTYSRQVTVSPPTFEDLKLLPLARTLFHKLYQPSKPVRLLGVRLSGLCPAASFQIDLFSKQDSGALYRSIDEIRARYGSDLLGLASGKKRSETSH